MPWGVVKSFSALQHSIDKIVLPRMQIGGLPAGLILMKMLCYNQKKSSIELHVIKVIARIESTESNTVESDKVYAATQYRNVSYVHDSTSGIHFHTCANK